MGKTLASAKAEVAKCAKGGRWIADHTEVLFAENPHDIGTTILGPFDGDASDSV
jgi:succinate-semialdehyde dehydrogenase/glutarate-semialdehyde dehydrogenase